MQEAAFDYAPCHPESTVLYQVVGQELETFLRRQEERDHPVPRFVEEEFRSFLDCGILARGFLRHRCQSCRCASGSYLDGGAAALSTEWYSLLREGRRTIGPAQAAPTAVYTSTGDRFCATEPEWRCGHREAVHWLLDQQGNRTGDEY